MYHELGKENLLLSCMAVEPITLVIRDHEMYPRSGIKNILLKTEIKDADEMTAFGGMSIS